MCIFDGPGSRVMAPKRRATRTRDPNRPEIIESRRAARGTRRFASHCAWIGSTSRGACGRNRNSSFGRRRRRRRLPNPKCAASSSQCVCVIYANAKRRHCVVIRYAGPGPPYRIERKEGKGGAKCPRSSRMCIACV